MELHGVDISFVHFCATQLSSQPFFRINGHKQGASPHEVQAAVRMAAGAMQLLVIESCQRTSSPDLLCPGNRLWTPSPSSWNAVTMRMRAGMTLPAVLWEEGHRSQSQRQQSVPEACSRPRAHWRRVRVRLVRDQAGDAFKHARQTCPKHT